MFLMLINQLATHGGVQRLARAMAASISRYAKERQVPVQIISLLDSDADLSSYENEFTQVRGFDGNKAKFVVAATLAARCSKAIYTNHPFMGSLPYVLSSLKPSIRYGIHAHGIEVWEPLSSIRQRAIRKANLVTCTSDYTRKKVSELQGVSPKRSCVLYPPMDENDTSIESESPHQEKLILTVSRLKTTEKGKYLDEGIKAFASLSTRYPEWRYVIVGDGDLRPILEKQALCLNVADRITFTGKVSDEELHRLYKSASLFLLPSLKEGLGIVFLEAMKQGVPCIAGNGGGSPEIVIPEKTGWLVDPRRDDELATVLASALDDENLRARLGKSAKHFVNNHFSFAKFHNRFSAMNDRLLGV